MIMLMPTAGSVEEGVASEVRLEAGSARSVHVEAGSVITVLGGIVWLTAQGDEEDYVLTAGERFVAERGGRVVIEPMRGRAAIAVR